MTPHFCNIGVEPPLRRFVTQDGDFYVLHNVDGLAACCADRLRREIVHEWSNGKRFKVGDILRFTYDIKVEHWKPE